MPRTEIIKKILDYAKIKPGMSFIEVERIFKDCDYDYEGEYGIYNPAFPNIIIWAGWNQKATAVIKEILCGKLLTLRQTMPLTYLIDGKALGFPIAKTARQYKKPHWLPVTLEYGGENR